MDASLPEFLLLFVIGLIVLGPERMAAVAKKIGQFVGYARRMSSNLQTQLEDELELKRIRETLPARVDLREQLGIDDIEKDLKAVADDVERAPGSSGETPEAGAAHANADAPESKAEAEPELDTSHHNDVVSADPDDEGMDHNDVEWEEEEDDYVPEVAASESRPASTAKSS
ncbi:MAG: twin-arginine translocase TatA/TatE family subunit [Pseudomonadota bacterium]